MAILRRSNSKTAQYIFVKKNSQVLAAVVLIVYSTFFLSCKKINEATDVGGDLVPAVDNVNTFELALETETDNFSLRNDSAFLLYGDQAAIGHLNDPEFGTTDAAGYFKISSALYSRYPFLNKGGVVQVDSVVLSLGYTGSYGDSAGFQTLKVFEIDQLASFNDTTLYRYTGDDIATTGTELGSKTFAINTLKDSLQVIYNKDTQRVANLVRIKLNNTLGNRFTNFDTTLSANGGFYNDSLFKSLFQGLAVKSDASGNALSFFDFFNTDKSRLIVYFRSTKDGKTDTSSASFYHLSSIGSNHPAGVANIVKRTPAGNWATYLANGNPKDDKLFIQSAPGSYGSIRIPALDNMTNKIVHLAELIAYRLPSAQDNIFTSPPVLYLDKINNAKDSAFIFEIDQPINGSTGEVRYLGGNLKTDNTFRFNITRHVQGILTRKEPNMQLRLYAPLRTLLNVKNNTSIPKIPVPVATRIAQGRVVVAGGNYSDPNLRLRLRLVYSNL